MTPPDGRPDGRITILQRANDARRHPPGVSTRVQRIAMRNDAHTLFDAMTPRERGMLIERAIDFRRDLAALDERRA